MIKYLPLVISLFLPGFVHAEKVSCGNVTIEQIITGPRHGSLLNISNNNCGYAGYVCLDLEGEFSSVEKGRAAYSFALASYMASKQVHITVETSFRPASCGGGYPVVEDIRTKS